MSGKARDPLLDSFAEIARDNRSLQETVEDTADLSKSPGETLGGGAAETAGQANPMELALTSAAGLYGDSANSPGADVQGVPLSGSGSSGAGSTAESVASTLFESGFGIAALVKGMMGLFGGDSSSQQPLEKYEMPSPIDFDSALTSGGMTAGNFDQTGTMRAIGGGASTEVPANGSGSAGSSQITVNVQAMDAQSFLDHSDDIAQAVRGAMLSMSSINDVVNEL